MTDALIDVLRSGFAEQPLRIGTRSSPMALHQAGDVRERILKLVPGISVELVPMTTSADVWSGDLSELGGKANFTKEIDRALTSSQVDVAVHCMKDVPGDVPLPKGTVFGAYLEREDVHDVVVTRDGTPLADIPTGSVIGTSSVRRRAQLLMYRPDLRVVRIRGNVNSRLAKLEEDNTFAALILAHAGLGRIDALDRHIEVLPVEFHPAAEGVVSIVPAVGAGVIGIQARTVDSAIMGLLDQLNDPATASHILAERTMLHMLRGHCNSPIAGYASTTSNGLMSLHGMVFNSDGSRVVRAHSCGDPSDPVALGSRVAADLLRQGARDVINATRT
ncbi:hydroxymethylbilane synthase [Nonomuraea polychroma]|uniref:hydroxymethylbilane synthase n=1 Tax=Nonomuraea polychroma TaxID=46176 RepID=UPI003D8D671B